jgi:hypothetical protein
MPTIDTKARAGARRSRSTPGAKENDQLEERFMSTIKVAETAIAEEATVGRIDSTARLRALETRVEGLEADAGSKSRTLSQLKVDLDDSAERHGEQIEVLFETFRRIETDLKTATAALAVLRAGTESRTTESKPLASPPRSTVAQPAPPPQPTFELAIPAMPVSQVKVVMLDAQRKQIAAVLAKPGDTVVFEAQAGQTRWFQMFANGQLQDETQMTA